MAITIKDIAKLAGVSHATVSRALRGNREISAETTRRIKKIAEEMGYVPNNAARGLKTNRTNALGVIVRRIDDPFFARVLDGIEDAAQKGEYSLVLAASGHDDEKDAKVLASFAERRVDGVILCFKRFEGVNRTQLRKLNIPVLRINDQAADNFGHAISHDDSNGAMQLAEHLIGLGHNKIAYVGNSNAGITNERRREGFREAMARARIKTYQEVTVDNGKPEGGVNAVSQLLAAAERPTAIMAYNDMVAVGVIRALKDAGVQVPEDCSVTGFDGIELAEYISPPLTTFAQPRYELGRNSAELLLSLIANPEQATAQSQTIQGKLVVRDSTAAPAAM